MSVAALVKDQVIVNCIVLSEADDVATLPDLFGVDEAFIVDDLDPVPGIGWSKATGQWEPPVVEEPDEPQE